MQASEGHFSFAGRRVGFWWLEALSLNFWGWEEFSVRFWSALSGLGLAAAAALSVRRGQGRGACLAAVIAGTTSLQQWYFCFRCR